MRAPLHIVVVGRTPATSPIRLGDTHLARALLGLGHRVTWVDPPLRWGRRRPRDPVLPGLDVVLPRVPPGARLLGGAHLVEAIVARAVRARGRVDAVLVADPRRAGVARLVGDVQTIYWCRDRFEVGRSRHREDAARQQRHLASYDLVTAVSPAVAASLRPVVRDVAIVANGCDAVHFATTPPRDTSERPTLGVLGGVGWRVDIGLLEGLAGERPDWRVIVIGEDESGSLPRLPNIEHRGRLPYADVPAALGPVDVGLIPYLDDDFNRASFPLKAFEYLAAGRPVVSSPIDALRDLRPYVRLASGLDDTVSAVEQALQGTPSEEACRRLGAENSWTSRATRLLELMAEGGGASTPR